MKKNIFFASALALLGLTACEKGFVDDIADVSTASQVSNSVLQVRTRSGGGVATAASEAEVAYPVTVYVFAGDECKAVQTIGDEGQTLNIALTEGTYSVCAVGGASTADYVLPSKDAATVTSAIALRDGRAHGDLMSATATATLTDGGTNTVTLGLQRKTMLIQSVSIKKVPTAATAVSVTIAPLWQSLTVGGTYSTTNGSTTIALTKQDDGRTWQNASSAYLLPPSSQPASISVNITQGGTTKTYTYSCSDQLEAGYKINIDGTYTEAVGVNLTGTITGATWLGERTITFEFDESGSSASGNDNNGSVAGGSTDNGDFPTVGSTYQGCYVLASTVAADGQSAEVMLMSPNEGMALGTDAAVNAAISTLGAPGISGWELPTKAQMRLVEAKLLADDATLTGEKYLWRKTNGTLAYRMLGNSDDTAWPSASTSATYHVRPVAIVSISKE